MKNKIKNLVKAANVIDKTCTDKGRSMAVKLNIAALSYALANSKNLSQLQLRNEWLRPLFSINAITAECRNAGYITQEPILG